MLISGAAVILSIWNHNQLENYMVSKLYKLVPARGDEQNEAEVASSKSLDLKNDQPLQNLKPPFLFNPKEYICELLRTFMCCSCLRKCKLCKASRMETAFEQARESLEKEIDIVKLLRQQRKIDAALKLLLTGDQLNKLNFESRYIKIDPQLGGKEDTSKHETPLTEEKKQSSAHPSA